MSDFIRNEYFTRNEAGRLCKVEFVGEKVTELLDGPWHAEPDRLEFRHLGFACLALRGPQLAWCGYIAIPPGHPWRTGAAEPPADGPEITYASPCKGDICHVPLPGESDDVLWFGFDCAHCEDFAPKDATPEHRAWRAKLWRSWGKEPPPDKPYRDLAYVTAELEKLAAEAQLGGVSPEAGGQPLEARHS